MMTTFGWKAAIAGFINATAATWLFKSELGHMAETQETERASVPLSIVMVHLAFLAAVVVFVHQPAVFLGLFLIFLGISTAYQRHQNSLTLREALLVAFFLAGLVVLGGLQ